MYTKKIKELYGCEYITSDKKLHPLQNWYNQLIDKSIDDITVADVLRMLRQAVFPQLAMRKAIEFLKKDSYIGELYEGQLLEKISEIDASWLVEYSDDLKNILNNVRENQRLHVWLDGEDAEDFNRIIESIYAKSI